MEGAGYPACSSMRIGLISDIHLDYNVIADFTAAFARICGEQRLDYLIFAGDTSDSPQKSLAFYSRLQSLVPTKIRAIAGNHEQYCYGEPGAGERAFDYAAACRKRYEDLLCDERFSLTRNPVLTKHWAVVGDTGWYDYTFDPAWPAVNLGRLARFERRGGVRGAWRSLCAGRPDGALDVARTEQSLRLLEDQLRAVSESPAHKNKRLCAVTHMLPTKQLSRYKNLPLRIRHLNYLGSERFSALYEKYGVTLSVSGHSHMRGEILLRGVRYVNVSLGLFFEWKQPLHPVREILRTMVVLED